MKNLAIKAENISKQYRLGEVGTGTLTHDLNRFWHKMRGNEDPYLKIGEANDRATKGESDYVWSLRDVNFEIEQGDAVGIIGRNGAGKSTLLKLLSKVTKPTTGNFKVNGRIASLLEVGTGFNPEMTGRENIYLNGAILGMRRHEITRKLDEIIDFSGVERYIDTPVKRYSSGMYVRLAFAVAAHLESEILIVDEVLAVGDAEFQKKCLGKMGDVSKGEGRTVLFVSHNLASIRQLCNSGIYMQNGIIDFMGDVNTCMSLYNGENIDVKEWNGSIEEEGIRILKTYVCQDNPIFKTDLGIEIGVVIEVIEKLSEIGIGFVIRNKYDEIIARCFYNDYNEMNSLHQDNHVIKFKIPPFQLAEGNYFIDFDISIPNIKKVSNEKCNLNFSLVNEVGFGNRYTSSHERSFGSLIRPNWFSEISNF